MQVQDGRQHKGLRDPRDWVATREIEPGQFVYFNGLANIGGKPMAEWTFDLNEQPAWFFGSPEEAINYFKLVEADGFDPTAYGEIGIMAVDRCKNCGRVWISPSQQKPPKEPPICEKCQK